MKLLDLSSKTILITIEHASAFQFPFPICFLLANSSFLLSSLLFVTHPVDRFVHSMPYLTRQVTMALPAMLSTFLSLPSQRSHANAYLEVSFAVGAGNLAPGANVGQMQVRFNKNDWSSFDQAQDYSYDGSLTTFAPSTKVTVYYKGVLIWGSEPV
jgi:hypothetical protein